MLFPLRDEKSKGAFPWIVILLLLTNIGLFCYQSTLSLPELQSWLATLAAYPREIVSFSDYPPASALPTPLFGLLTSMFLHGGLWHLLCNILFLWIFADNIEQAMGHRRFIFFYLLVGVIATLAHVLTNAQSEYPLVGASGAISGVLGAYLLLYPRNRILALAIIWPVRIPAFFFIGFWFFKQLLFAPQGGSVAWYAHIGGFLAGMALTPFFVRLSIQRR